MAPGRILLIDDEPSIRRTLSRVLSEHDVSVAESARAAIELLEEKHFDLVDMIKVDVLDLAEAEVRRLGGLQLQDNYRALTIRNSKADWVWFTDCDVVFGAGCLDGLATALQGRRDTLVFPRVEHVSAVLEPGDPVLEAEDV